MTESAAERSADAAADAREASGTALGVAYLRAAHLVLDGEPKILDDPVALRLLAPGAEEQMVEVRHGLFHPRALALRAHLLVRSRYAEDRLADAAARGVDQYVLVGAGLDTFAYRQPEWARSIRIFEVDHPASQRAKRERLERAGVVIPPNLAFVECDLERDTLHGTLAAAGFHAAAPAFASMLGVMMYLAPETVDAVFRELGSLAATSELVFTFSPPPDEPEPEDSIAARAAAAGEPWRTRLTPEELEERLAASGFSSVTFVPAEEIERLYFRGRRDALPPPRHSRIVRAVV